MKLITALIKPDRIDLVKESLKGAGVTGLTVSEAHGFGRRGGHTETYRGSEYQVDLVPRARLEMVVADRAEVEKVVNVLAQEVRIDQAPGGKVWVTDVEWVVSLRTGEMNDEAL